MKYHDLVQSDPSPLVTGLASGRIRLRFGIDRQPFDYLGFPPALIPMWYREGPIHFGIWKHRFCDRTISYVRMSLEDHYGVREHGRTPEQLAWMELAPGKKPTTANEINMARRFMISPRFLAEFDIGDAPPSLLEYQKYNLSRSPGPSHPDFEFRPHEICHPRRVPAVQVFATPRTES